MSKDPIPYDLLSGLGTWAVTVLTVLVLGLFVASLVYLLLEGPCGIGTVFRGLLGGLADIAHTSSRRVWALTQLTLKESIRRKTLGVIVVFGVCFLFAGWFLSSPEADPDMQVKVYVSFVLTAISWLILPAVFLLACWGLPEDIKARSLHTVVTKPVRRFEVIAGRVLGIVLVGTMVLLVMSGAGYLWLNRALDSRAKEKLVARVPVYGEITFTSRDGKPAAAGVNVGDVWAFRSYVEGNTQARAIWEFPNVTESRFPDDSLTLESSIQVFRTHKGDIESGVLAQYVFVNPETGKSARLPAFPVREFRENIHEVPRELIDDSNQSVDLFRDLVQKDGTLRVEVFCLSSGQYLGMARPDLFIRQPDAPFAASYFKAISGIWLMMTLVIVLGVTASSFAKGPVATLLTFVFLVVGRIGLNFLNQLTSGTHEGGGPAESVYRILLHMNPTVPLTKTPLTTTLEYIDKGFLGGLAALKHVIPDFQRYNFSEFTANGFDVPWDAALLPALALTIGFVIPCLVLGYFSLKARELESK